MSLVIAESVPFDCLNDFFQSSAITRQPMDGIS